MKQTNIIEIPDGWEIRPSEFHVSRCIVDHEFSFELMNSQGKVSMLATIGTDFVISQAENEKTILISDTISIGHALVLFEKRLLSGQMYKNGHLKLEFSDGIDLQVKPDEMYESWEIRFYDGVTPIDGTRFLCMPGGKVAYWWHNTN